MSHGMSMKELAYMTTAVVILPAGRILQAERSESYKQRHDTILACACSSPKIYKFYLQRVS